MIYKKYMALILVFGILSCEPTMAFQIGSDNDINSEKIIYTGSNGEKTFNKSKENTMVNNPRVFLLNKLNKAKTNHELKTLKNHEKNHKSLKNYVQTSYVKEKCKKVLNNSLNNSSNQPSDSAKMVESSFNTFIDDKNVNKIELASNDENYEVILNNETGLNNISTNDSSSGDNNQSVTNDNINNTTISPEIDLNNTIANDTLNLCNGTINLESEESTKDKVTDTLLAVGYVSAAIAAACAMNPEPLVSKIICAVAVTVAVVSFVSVIFVKWLW